MKEYPISIQPRILELLGPNLYTNIYFVLAELIANAYDADAKNVYIISSEDYIRVEDDGHGMSYDKGDVAKYLLIANVSRSDESDSWTRSNNRKKMGRKGVGKLAALSVSENVSVMTIASGEKSGFILSRHPKEDNKLEPIEDEQIEFAKIDDHGTAIIMHNPQYKLSSNSRIVSKNLLRIFPLISVDFQVHISIGKQSYTLNDFDRSMMKELCTIYTYGSDFEHLLSLVPCDFPDQREELIKKEKGIKIDVEMLNNKGVMGKHELLIVGWIGTYKTTTGRRKEYSDFPDNFISIFANKKMGEFNVLPTIGQNKLNEVYVVGQIHVDLFEKSDLPDMALSNRQGYKTDDPRYIALIDFLRKEALPKVISLRETYVRLKKNTGKVKETEAKLQVEEELKKSVEVFREKTANSITNGIVDIWGQIPKERLKEIVQQELSNNSPDLGLKVKVDSNKKKILISQTSNDKILSDLIYDMFCHNNVPPQDILYTNCDNGVSRIPISMSVHDYLRKFFVDSYSDKKIYVVFVTSESMAMSWGAITEVGAAWITKADHNVINVEPFRPMQPLDTERQWASIRQDESIPKAIYMNSVNADVFCDIIEAVCSYFGYAKRSRQENLAFLTSHGFVRT